MPWLVAALQRSSTSDPAAAELIAAAHAVKPESPAYESVTYYGILTQIRAGELDGARSWADGAIGAKPSPELTNLLRSERLSLARNWNDFVRFASRQAVAESSLENSQDEEVAEDTAKNKPFAFDEDSVDAFNQSVPLALWVDAAGNDAIPRNLQTEIARAGWVRAILAGDRDAARSLAARAAQLAPELAPQMRAWLAEKDPDASRFAAIFLMLRSPGMEPVLRPGLGRETAVTERDIFRDNWWVLTAATPKEDPKHQALSDLYPDGHFGPKDFLPAEQRAAGEEQWKQIADKASNSVNFLCAATLDWARAHPQDPRVPQALYLAVEATHYGPADKSSGYSRQAFDLLHRRYPDSEWTKKTKYWY